MLNKSEKGRFIKSEPSSQYFDLIGQKINTVTKILDQKGVKYRLIKPNCLYTCDYVPERLNLRVKDNVVVGISFG